MLRTVLGVAWLLLLAAVALPDARAADASGVGFRRLEVVDPVSGRPMDAALFYPGTGGDGTTEIGPYDIDGLRGAEIAPGRHPLVLVSHGDLGSLWGHHDLASFLARKGFLVVSVLHPGDNYRDPSGLGAVSTIYGRPLQISAALTAALQAPFLAGRIDSDRIGFAGFSAGGTTGLILAGAQPDLSRLETYCAARPADHAVCEAGGRIRNDRPDLLPTADPRIGAFVLLAPLSVVFPRDGLKRVEAPLRLYVGDADQQLSPERNALALARDLPVPPALEVLPGAGHFVFLAPCSARLAASLPALCRDAPGVDRAALHRQMNAEIARFLDARSDGAPRR
ncbi:Predicted dienelactone hydrolase [Tistlia consotensis]|uniref:Predicted dienelactone hydrolase n=1 Tax=Tistlia consotensis USBA 355 TaxID=560819 RepID=A0A1Y6BNY3_9PROT|nr:dienelactone hydrolase [Tistlia consotensis]SMF20767.1 Predicted dienelactone hydrolase [Tistlia consotensis USBA 355]SNR47569.1 Predicted dienelactone hydrolase [Tistlia consotensis]